MTIEIHDPEVERIVTDAVLDGRFASAEAVLSEAVLAWRKREAVAGVPAHDVAGHSLLEFFRQSPLVGLELEIDRSQDLGRDIEL